MRRAGVLLSAAMAALGAVSGELAAQCDGPVVVQVPQEAASIADAVAMACQGHPLEIVLAEGTWPMAVNTGDPSIEITIRGVSKTASIVTETKAGVPLNTGGGSRIRLISLTVQDVDINPSGYHWYIVFDDCIVRNVVGQFHSWGDMAARDTQFIDCAGGFGTIYTLQSDVISCQFINCSRPLVIWCEGVLVDDCHFADFTGHAISLKAQATIRNSVFTNGLGATLVTSSGSGNCGLGAPTQPYVLQNCTFTNCASGVPGGAISDRTDANTPRIWQITNCTFTNNSAPSGGAMYFGIDRNVTLTNCVFEGNSATQTHGGAFAHEPGGYANSVLAENCQFNGNSAVSGAGGAIFTVAWGGSDTLINCHFEDNSAAIGGAYRTDRHAVMIDGCSFVGNVATGPDSGRGGGAIAMEVVSQAVITGSTFTDNTANRGGAIDHYWYCSGISISACGFSGNRGLLSGGAIAARDYCKIGVMTCWFDGGIAPHGAAIHCTGGVSDEHGVTVASSQFSHHAEAASAVQILAADGLPITATSNVFCDNAIPATFGDVSFDASNCVVEFCTDADGDGEVDGCACPGDLNGNFTTDGADLSILLGYWGPVTNPNVSADLNDDGQVDGADLAVMLGGWGACP